MRELRSGRGSYCCVSPYFHSDLATKERALERRSPLKTSVGRYRPGDALLTFLDALW